MVSVSLALPWRLVIYLIAGVAAGMANGIAGGGTFITFPTMLAMGVGALQANVSSTVGVVPSYFGGIRGFRHEIRRHSTIVASLAPICLAGTLVGTALLLFGSPKAFETVVPWLIGVATVVYALSPLITARLAHLDHHHPSRRRVLFVGVFLASIYGGYFGAGLGIVLLAIMAVALPLELGELQGLRNLLSLIINVVAAVVFLVRGHLAQEAIYMILVGTLVGGWLGTVVIRRLQPATVRWLIVAIGAATTVHLALGA